MSQDRGSPSARHAQGMETRRAVLGADYVDGKVKATDPFDAPFQDLITEAAWGHVWSSEGWSKRERSMVTIALLAALGHYEELDMHVRASVRTGATIEDLREAMMHVAIYAGVPHANHAFKVIKAIIKEGALAPEK